MVLDYFNLIIRHEMLWLVIFLDRPNIRSLPSTKHSPTISKSRHQLSGDSWNMTSSLFWLSVSVDDHPFPFCSTRNIHTQSQQNPLDHFILWAVRGEQGNVESATNRIRPYGSEQLQFASSTSDKDVTALKVDAEMMLTITKTISTPHCVYSQRLQSDFHWSTKSLPRGF